MSVTHRELGWSRQGPDFETATNCVLVVPIGSIEPHAHLPLATDTMISESLARRIVEVSPNSWLFPALPIGTLFKYSSWTGSVGVGGGLLEDLLVALLTDAKRMGFSRFFIFSGHDENREPCLTALRRVCRQDAAVGVYADWIDLATTLVKEISTSRREGHASEIQTSVFHYLFPDACLKHEGPRTTRTNPEPLIFGADDLFADTEQGSWVEAIPEDDRASCTGDPSHASIDKGERVVLHICRRGQAIIQELVSRSRRHPQPNPIP